VSSATPTRAPVPFSDGRGCKEWLNVLPLTNIPQAQQTVLETLQSMRAADMNPLERLKCLEMLRDKIAFLQGEQRSRYFGKTIPLSPNDSTAWVTGRSLLEEMESGYRQCLAAAEDDPGGMGKHTAIISQRVMRYIGGQMLFHAIVFKRFDPALWQRLHQLYSDCETRGTANEAVKDSLEGEEGVTSVAQSYAQSVLIQAAFLSEMSAPQVDFAEALLRLWARKVQVLAQSPEGSNAPIDALVVDLTKSIGARPQPRGSLQASQRVLDTSGLSLSIRKRVHGLQNGEDFATLGLPAQASALDVQGELQRLHKLWCEGAPPRPASKAPSQPNVGLVFGMSEIYFFITGGKAFEQPDKKRELTSAEKQDIEVFGRIREQTQSKMVAEFNYTVENWAALDEGLGNVRAQRPSTASKGVGIRRLAALRMGDTGAFFLAMVNELTQETDGKIAATLTIFPGKPEAIAVRAGDLRNRASAQWVPGFRLPALEKAQIPSTIIVPSPHGTRGRGIEIWTDGAPKESTIEDLLLRGTDFDRATVF
jgi:hypothetical protein